MSPLTPHDEQEDLTVGLTPSEMGMLVSSAMMVISILQSDKVTEKLEEAGKKDDREMQIEVLSSAIAKISLTVGATQRGGTERVLEFLRGQKSRMGKIVDKATEED